MTGWKTEIMTRYPQRFERLNDNQWIERVDITTHKNEDADNVKYICHSRILSNEEYSAISNSQDIAILMKAVADLYIAIEELKG